MDLENDAFLKESLSNLKNFSKRPASSYEVPTTIKQPRLLLNSLNIQSKENLFQSKDVFQPKKDFDQLKKDPIQPREDDFQIPEDDFQIQEDDFQIPENNFQSKQDNNQLEKEVIQPQELEEDNLLHTELYVEDDFFMDTNTSNSKSLMFYYLDAFEFANKNTGNFYLYFCLIY